MPIERLVKLRSAVHGQIRSADHLVPVGKALDIFNLLSAEGSGHDGQASTFL
jgi:hypothetical protein